MYPQGISPSPVLPIPGNIIKSVLFLRDKIGFDEPKTELTVRDGNHFKANLMIPQDSQWIC